MFILAVVLVAYAVFFCVTVTAIAALPRRFTGLAVPLGCVAAAVVLSICV